MEGYSPPGFAMKDGFYSNHTELLSCFNRGMVRSRLKLADRDFVYSEKVSFFKFNKNTRIFPGHHRISSKEKTVSYAADKDLKVNEKFYDYNNYIQGVVIHRCFVTLSHRTRYLPESEYKKKVEGVLKGGEVKVFEEGISRRWEGSLGLPYLGGRERQKVIFEEIRKEMEEKEEKTTGRT